MEQDLLDRLATEADLNRVVEYEGMEVDLVDNDPNDAREKEGVADMEDEWQDDAESEEGVAENEGVDTVLDAEEKHGVSEMDEGVAENEDADAVLELPVNHLAMVVAEQGVPSTPCGHKTTGDVGLTKWQVMMADLGDTIIGHNYLQQMRIRQSIPVT